MQIIDAIWRPDVNRYVILCDCGCRFTFPVNFWWIRCPDCGLKEWVETIRQRGVPRRGGEIKCIKPY